MDNKTKVIGIFYIIFGALGILGLPLIYVYKLLVNQMLTKLSQIDGGAREMVDFMHAMMEILIPALVALTIAHIVVNVLVGVFFIKHKAYYTCLVTSIFTCLVFPIGTVLGVFALVALFDEETKKLFNRS